MLSFAATSSPGLLMQSFVCMTSPTKTWLTHIKRLPKGVGHACGHEVIGLGAVRRHGEGARRHLSGLSNGNGWGSSLRQAWLGQGGALGMPWDRVGRLRAWLHTTIERGFTPMVPPLISNSCPTQPYTSRHIRGIDTHFLLPFLASRHMMWASEAPACDHVQGMSLPSAAFRSSHRLRVSTS
jgi:hypothetical protein